MTFPTLRPAIRSFIQHRVRDTALADDLTQETLLRVYLGIATLRTPEKLEPFAFQVARNTVADHFRKVRPVESFDEERHADSIAPAVESALDEVLSPRLSEYVRSTVNRLPPLYRNAVAWSDLDGVPQAEIARRLGLTVTAAKSRVQRGRARLRKEMERCCRWETDRYGRILSAEPRLACGCQRTES